MIWIAAPLCAFLALFLAACDLGSPYTKGVEKTADAYFRITADYTVIDTGERINFDYVMVCGGTITHSTYTSSTVRYSSFPNLIIQPTRTGEAVGVNTPALCEAWGWRYIDKIGGRLRDPDPIPDDFTPFTLWYPDVTALGFAFGYESDLAYESPYSRLEFHGSTLERVDKDAWEAWRKKAEEEFEPVGGVPGPWGMSLVRSPRYKEIDAEIRSRNKGAYPAIGFCAAVAQLDLPEKYKPAASAIMSDEVGQFSNLHQTEDGNLLRRDIYGEREPLFNGARVGNHYGLTSALGVRRSDTGELRSNPVRRRDGSEFSYIIAIGGGRINAAGGKGNFYHDVFPVLWRDLSLAEQFAEDESFYSIIALIQPEWNGFSICSEGQANLDDVLAYVQRQSSNIPVDYTLRENWDAYKATPHRVYFNNDEMARAPNNLVPGTASYITVIDRDGHVYPACCAGRR